METSLTTTQVNFLLKKAKSIRDAKLDQIRELKQNDGLNPSEIACNAQNDYLRANPAQVAMLAQKFRVKCYKYQHISFDRQLSIVITSAQYKRVMRNAKKAYGAAERKHRAHCEKLQASVNNAFDKLEQSLIMKENAKAMKLLDVLSNISIT